MPHCIIEVTENLLQDIDKNKLMKEVAQSIFSLGCFSADDIKVRLYPVEYSFLGLKEQEHSYVTAEIQVIDNKTKEQLNTLADKVQDVLLNYLNEPIAKTSITTQVSFLNKAYYKRFKNF